MAFLHRAARAVNMATPSLSSSVASSRAAPIEDLRHRRHTLKSDRSWMQRLVIGFQQWLEARVAGASPLGDPHIYVTRDFPWAATIETEWTLIRKELDALMVFRDQMPSFQDIFKEVGAIQSDNNWKTYFLAGIGMDCTENAKRCPETVRLLGKIPGMTTAFFSILSPGKHIPAHRGAWNGILRLHVGLMIPQPRERVKIRVGNDFYSWREGEAFIFDDTFNHEVWNDTDGYRVVLLVDFARPLRQPWRWINERILRWGALVPFLREAGEKQKRWQDLFWETQPSSRLPTYRTTTPNKHRELEDLLAHSADARDRLGAVLLMQFERARAITLGDAICAAEKHGLRDDDAIAAVERLARAQTAGLHRFYVDRSGSQARIVGTDEVRERAGDVPDSRRQWASSVEVVWAMSEADAITRRDL